MPLETLTGQSEPSNSRDMDTTTIKGANFNEDGDVVGHFMVDITYTSSYSLALNKKYVEIYDYTVLEGKATEQEIIEATEIEFRNVSVSIEI